VLDIRLIREQPDFFRERLKAGGAGDEGSIAELLQWDEKRRSLLANVEKLKAERNRLSKEIGALMSQQKTGEADIKKFATRDIGRAIAELEKGVAEAEAARSQMLLRWPNLPHLKVATGSSPADNSEVRAWGEQPKFPFQPKSHIDLCEKLGFIDFDRSTKLSVTGFLH